MSIDFDDETRRRAYESLQRFFREQFDEDLGLLRTEQVFEFMVGLIGAQAYNQAVSDAQAWLQRRLLDLEGDLNEEVEG